MKKIILIVVIFLVALLLFWQLFFRNLNVMGKAALTWNPSSQSDVKGYKIYYGTEPRKGDCPQTGGYPRSANAGNTTSYQLDNLQNNTTYYFSVTSLSVNGKESCFSQEMKKTVKISFLDKLKALF